MIGLFIFCLFFAAMISISTGMSVYWALALVVVILLGPGLVALVVRERRSRRQSGE